MLITVIFVLNLSKEGELKMAQRIVSGMRPTGKLHLGHYLGVIDNWVQLQKDF